jgi:hypothetical protein
MTCDTCKKETEDRLANGRCIGCVATENATLRLLVAHMIMAIESGTQSVHPIQGPCYTQEFGQAFLIHLKTSLGILEPTPPPGTLTRKTDECQNSEQAQA